MNNPLVSVIVPVYNTESFLRKCLDSIINQTYTNFEAVLVDDGSTDRSGAICDEYALKDDRLKVIHQENQGVTMARIVGFDNCRGELIAFIDSDDYVSSDYLEQLSKPILNDGADIVCCDFYRVKEHTMASLEKFVSDVFQGNSLRDFITNHFLFYQQTKGYGIPPGLVTKMTRRCFVKDGLLLGKGLWYGEDTIALLFIMQGCDKLVALSDRLYYYVEHDGETIKRYDSNLWVNIIELLQRIEFICHEENLTIYGIRSRTWKYISDSIYKMYISGMTYPLFYNDISVVRNHPYMVRYFKPWLIEKEYGIKGNIGYFFLKLRMYRILWMLEIIKDYKYERMR